MKRLAAVALLVAGMVGSAWGQRGGARGGGGAGRSVAMSAPRSGFALSSRFSYTGARIGYSPSVSTGGYTNALPAFRAGAGVPVRRPVYGASGRYRTPYLAVPYGYALPYGVASWLGPDALDYSYAPADAGAAYNATAPQPNYSSPDGSGYPGGYGPPPMEQASPDSYAPAYAPQPPPADEEAVTLIFKDGRPSEHIHNYILTPKTLFVQDEHHRIIPVDQLDLAATVKANLDAGIVFQLPETRR